MLLFSENYSALSRRVTDMNFIYNISFRGNTYTVQINRLENKYAIKEKFMESGTELVLLTQRSTTGLSFCKKSSKNVEYEQTMNF